MRKIFFLLILLLLLAGGLWYAFLPSSAVHAPAEPEVFSDPKNGTYTIEHEPVTLSGGTAEASTTPGSVSRQITEYFGDESAGDVNGDGIPDAVFLLTETDGGSGTFYYVAAALGGKGGYTGTNAVFVGDRIAPQNTEIDASGQIIVNYADRLPNEPYSAAPTVAMSKYFAVQNGALVEIDNPALPQTKE